MINFVSTFNFFRDISWSESVRHIGCLCKVFFTWFIFQKLLGISWTSFTAETSRHGFTIARVGKMMTSFCCLYSQYQLVFSCIYIIYFALTTSSLADIICPSHIVSYCKVYTSEKKPIRYYPIFGKYVVFMAPYLLDWNNEAVFSLIPSRTTLWISLKSSPVVDLCWNLMIFQLLKELITSQ